MSVAAAKTVVAAPSVKPDVMALAKKHHFWILSGLLVLIPTGLGALRSSCAPIR